MPFRTPPSLVLALIHTGDPSFVPGQVWSLAVFEGHTHRPSFVPCWRGTGSHEWLMKRRGVPAHQALL